MNVELDTLPNCLATLHVEVPADEVAKVWDSIAREYAQYARIPGYRPGKAPRGVVEGKFKKEIREQVQQKVLSESYREAIKEKNLRALAVENVEDIEFGEDKSIKYTATVVTAPEFELPEYKGIPVEVNPAIVSDEEVDEALENLRNHQADFEDVPERGLQMDDYAVIDYTGTIVGKLVQDVFPKAGKPLSTGADFWLRLTPESFFPGFSDQLAGANVGDSREFDIEVPADFQLGE